MKKSICFLLALLSAASLSGCSQDAGEQISRIEALEAQVIELEASIAAKETEKEILSASLADAEQKQSELSAKLQNTLNEKEELSSVLTEAERAQDTLLSASQSLQSEIDRLKNALSDAEDETEVLQEKLRQEMADMLQIEDVFHLSNGDKVLLTYDHNRPDYKYWRLTLLLKDGTLKDIHNDYSVTAFAASPDCTKFAFSNFEMEGSADGYWYDCNTGKTTEISREQLGINHGPADFFWLDNRYFLFLSRFDHGTISQGGDVYVYDTETDAYRLLIQGSRLVEIQSFEYASHALYRRDTVFFHAVRFDETLNYTTQKSFTVSIENLMQMVRDGQTMTFDGDKLF